MPSEDAVRVVYLDPKSGVIAKLGSDDQKRQKLMIECGTVSSACITEVAEAFSSMSHVNFLDAPISGGPMGSTAGTLSFMVGCDDEDLFDQVKSDLLVHMGDPKNIFHCGKVGTGTAFKIINNYISLVSVASVSEAYNIAQRMDLDLNVLTDMLGSGSAQCWVVSKNNPVPGIHPHVPASNGYRGGFRLDLAEKDLNLGQKLADSVGASAVMNKAALEIFQAASGDERYAGKDARVVYKYLVEKD